MERVAGEVCVWYKKFTNSVSIQPIFVLYWADFVVIFPRSPFPWSCHVEWLMVAELLNAFL